MTGLPAVSAAMCVALVVLTSACSTLEPATQDRPGSSAGATVHNPADVVFLQQMISHHAQAVEMSNVLVAKSAADPQVVAQALSIRIRQASEITMMRGWLTTWGVDPAAQQPVHYPGMCGMVSPADLAALQDADGPAASRLYLELMIAHHAGAIVMARTEVDAGRSRFATDFARGVVSSQQLEIDVMRSMPIPEITVDGVPVC